MSAEATILNRMIESDIKELGISEYRISERISDTERLIRVKENEIAYVTYFFTRQMQPFTVQLTSGTECIEYNGRNTTAFFQGGTNGVYLPPVPPPVPTPFPPPPVPLPANTTHHKSNLITRHRGNIAVSYSGIVAAFLFHLTILTIVKQKNSTT